MYTLIMREDKQLLPSGSNVGQLFEMERNIDTFRFLVVPTYGDLDLSKCVMTVKYITPAGIYNCRMIQPEKELYKGFLDYRMPIDAEITSKVGVLRLRLCWMAVDSTSGIIEKEYCLKSSDYYMEVTPAQMAGEPSSDPTGEITIMKQQLATAVEKVEMVQNELMNKADDIEVIDNQIWAMSDGKPVGDPIPLAGSPAWKEY